LVKTLEVFRLPSRSCPIDQGKFPMMIVPQDLLPGQVQRSPRERRVASEPLASDLGMSLILWRMMTGDP